MCNYSNPYYSYPYYSAYGTQPTPIEPLPLPSLSTTALQDVVEGQQRATSGLVTLLSQERTSNERSARDNKQQLNNLVTLSQNFLGFIPDVEQKFSALESSIRVNCLNTDNAELQDRLNDMDQVITNLSRIAESFASSAGLRLVPGPAPNQWSWVPASTPPLQQDYASFFSTFPQAPHIFPTTIPHSTRSSVAHSHPTRSVHWPSDLDTSPASYCVPPYPPQLPPWLDPYSSSPYSAGNAPSAFSRISLGGVRGFSGVPSCMTPTPSDPSSPPYGPCSPAPSPQSGRRSFPFAVPIESLYPRSSTPPASTPSQTESVVGSLHRTQLSTISESRTSSPTVPAPPAFGRTPNGGPSPSTSTIETLSTPTGAIASSANAPQARVQSDLAARNDPTRLTLIDMMYPSVPSSNAPSITDFSLSSPPRVEIPSSRSIENVHWSSLFPSAPVVMRPPHLTRVSSVDETVSSMSSPTRSIICYSDSAKLSSPSEPLTPLSRMSGEIIEAPPKLTTDTMDKPKELNDLILSSVTAGAQAGTVASTSDAQSDSTYRNQLAIQLVSFFFESVQRIFKVPTSVDLTYKGFEVSFSAASISWNDASVVGELADDEDSEQDRNFEMMPAPSNAALHRYIRDLARVRMDLAAMQVGEKESKEQAVVQLELRVKAEQELAQSWIRRVCKAAGALSIVDPAFSPRK